MAPSSWFAVDRQESPLEVLREDGDFVLYRTSRQGDDGDRRSILTLVPAPSPHAADSLARLNHEYDLKDQLDRSWAALPLELVREHEHERTLLVLTDPGGVLLDRLIGSPMGIALFLRLAIALAEALGQLHGRGLVHKDIKPSNIFFDSAVGRAWLTGFGIASRLPREHQSPVPPEFIAGTLPYMAPEQTGRMNRSIDSRSDLYSLGVTLYELLTGQLPFTASDPMEWVHCHIAKEPATPSERLNAVPAPVFAIILKLLAKSAEERYQTAVGLERDLRHCLWQWQQHDRIGEFTLGQHDRPDRLLIPEKLYGRAAARETLLASFARVAATGTAELILVSGYAGVGKSSLVKELQKVLTVPRGLFSQGKFDQSKRDIPYATFAQAFQSLVRTLLSKPEAQLCLWRDALLEALGPNGRLMTALVPELKHIVGEQPPVPVLAPQDAQRRFQLVFRRFIDVFAQPEHPLALFLDDLQWLDAATLDLLEDLLSHADVRHLMLIGAYRDNEVDPSHPLMRKLETIRGGGATVREIILAPLGGEDTERLVADSLRSDPEEVASLAQLVQDRTGGNPFFAIQFLSSLAEENLLIFDHREGRWSWDLQRIHAKGYTNNVVDLMVWKLTRLPERVRNALQQLACLGNSVDFALLEMTYGDSNEDTLLDLQEALQAGLLVRSEAGYAFSHDRIQEAAYSLLPEDARAAVHLRMGRLLAARSSAAKQTDLIFEVVNQLSRGVALITLPCEREQLAGFYLIAGKRAMASTAYASALKYVSAGADQLAEDRWERQHQLTFELELHRAECEFLTGQPQAADERLTMLSSHAASTVQQATVASLRVDLYTTLDHSDRAVAVCLEYLRHLGIRWSPHPTQEEAREEYERIWSQLGSRTIEQLAELPLMSDAASLATLEVLTKVLPPALFTDANLVSLVICRAVNLSIEAGNSDGSCVAYGWLGQIAGPHFGNYQAGFRFGCLGYELVQKRGLERFRARILAVFANHVLPWMKHVRTCRHLVHRAFEAANTIGDLSFAAYSCVNLNTSLLAAGDALVEVQRQAENGLAFARQARFGLVVAHITVQLAFVRALRGLAANFGTLDDDNFNERTFEGHLASHAALAQPACFYWIRKLQICFLAGDYSSALDASENAQRLISTAPSNLEIAEYHLYDGLCRAACWDSGSSREHRHRHLEALTAHHKQLQLWAENCPDNFAAPTTLVGAEIARIDGRELDAERLYEEAIRSAHANGFIHNEAVAYEVAARFYATRGFDKFSEAYLREARRCYLRWGAAGKVRQLDESYPHLTESARPTPHTSTIDAPLEYLDLATVIKLSKALSGEVVLEKLIDTLMRTAIEHAAATRGVLLVAQGDRYRTVAEATANGVKVHVGARLSDSDVADLPESVVHYVIRTKESTLLDDAWSDSPFSADRYFQQHKARSVLCLPLLKESRLIGVLYLENKLTPRAFPQGRLVVLKLLATQAAISLENMRLYVELQEREAKIRRLVDSNIIGIFTWCADGRIVEANEAFLRIVHYDRHDVTSGRLSWRDLTPAEWRDADDRRAAEVKALGVAQPYEKEYFRKGGGRVPVLVGGAAFEKDAEEGVAFVVDLSDRKHAEMEVRESERRYHEIEMALARANRIATLGHMSASIAHEINQPVAATVTNAQAALRFLEIKEPNIEEVRQALHRIARLGDRVAEVITRVRALVKNLPARREKFDINEAICEVISLSQGELVKNGVSAKTSFTNGVSLLHADRVQLQQVILNLMMNAIEAMNSRPEGSRELRISTAESRTHEILVTVDDSGPGLELAQLERIFDAFYSTKRDGLGIGLSICRSIVEAHGGRLWAAASDLGGAAFTFTLPAQLDPGSVLAIPRG